MEGPSSKTTMQYPSDETESFAPPSSSSASSAPVGRGPGGLLTVAGLGMAAAGTALAALPRFAPQFDWSVRNLASEGVMGGTFAVGGCLLIAMGLAARAQSRFFRAASERSDADLLLEHIAGELTDIRSEIRDTNQRVGYVRDETRGLFEAVQAREGMDSADNDTMDATFRMAASLDQLGARIDQRMQARDAAIENVFGELQQQLAEVRTLAEELRGTLAAGYACAPEPETAYAQPAVQMAHATAPPAMAAPIAQERPQGPPQGLDLLDSLDQPPTGTKTSLRDQPAAAGYRPLGGPELGVEHEPRAPLPQHGRVSAPISLTMRPGTGPIDVDDERIAEIRALLADERVREKLQLG